MGFRLTVGKEVAADAVMVVTVVCLVFGLPITNFPPSVSVNDREGLDIRPESSGSRVIPCAASNFPASSRKDYGKLIQSFQI